MALVIDASVTIAWVIDGEATPYTEGILNRLAHEEALVPPIWRYEIANALLVSERRGRITLAGAVEAFQRVADLPITIDEGQSSRTWSEVFTVARTFQLSVYDASYVDLA
ncbi:MAG TPA: type II toxin-antitoxin system VapC family toxin, partial [Thermomicrobiales bacterium]|nr:type II toxin-antitoxin system VapC family toxin [Thermomicrobiales bacterium]